MNRHNRKMLLNIATGVAVAATAVVVFLPAAYAAPGTVTGNVNVRSGPGTNYAVVDTATRGTSVDVQQCQGSWCYVAKPGPDGWISSTYLNRSGVTTATPVQPNTGFGVTIGGGNGPTINFGIGQPQPQPAPQPPVVRPTPAPVFGEACFYDRTSQRGTSFCLEEGESVRDLGNWTDRISSIDNADGLSVQVCSEPGYRNCRTYTTSASSLGDFDDYIASIRVR